MPVYERQLARVCEMRKCQNANNFVSWRCGGGLVRGKLGPEPEGGRPASPARPGYSRAHHKSAGALPCKSEATLSLTRGGSRQIDLTSELSGGELHRQSNRAVVTCTARNKKGPFGRTLKRRESLVCAQQHHRFVPGWSVGIRVGSRQVADPPLLVRDSTGV